MWFLLAAYKILLTKSFLGQIYTVLLSFSNIQLSELLSYTRIEVSTKHTEMNKTDLVLIFM